LFETFYGVVYI